MKKEVFRTISLRFTIILISGFLLLGYGYYNLKSNSVYYAKNTPHKEGTEPVLMMLVDNLFWISTPEIDGIEYSFDGGNSVGNKNYNGELQTIFTGGQDGKYYDFFDNKMAYYEFNKKFDLTYSADKNLNKKPLMKQSFLI